MKTLFALCSLLLALSSCLTVSKIERNCDKFATICTTDREIVTYTRDTTIFRTDTIFFTLPADTLKITDTVRIENNQVILKPIYKQVGYIGVKAFIKNNSLNINAWLTDSTILIPYRDTILIPGAITTTTATNTVTVTKKHIPGFYKFCFWLVIAQISIAALWIGSHMLPLKK